MNTFEGTLSIRGQIEGDRLHVYLSSTLRMAAPRLRNAKGPMLAKRWSSAVPCPRFAQPKLNGWRMLATRAGLQTRTGERINTLPHIERALATIFRRHPTLTLDGEAYAHGTPLPQIAGTMMRGQPNTASETIKFHIFDYIDPVPYDVRQARLASLVPSDCDALTLVRTVACQHQRDLDNHYAECLAAGYEGQMLRDPAALYIRGRSNALLKRKPQPEADDVLFSAHDPARDHIDLMGDAAR